MHRLILAFGLLLTSLPAQSEPPLLTRTYSSDGTDLNELKAAIESVLSPRGKIIPLPQKQKLIVQDDPEHMAGIEAIVKELTALTPNVRIEVTLNETGGDSERGVDVRGRVNVGGVDIGNSGGRRNSIQVNPIDRGMTTGSLASQFLVVRNGGSAYITVGEEVPFVDYFQSYAVGLGYAQPAFRWEHIGTRLSIKPIIQGRNIQVEVTPEVTSLVDAREQVISYRNLTSTVTVADGYSVQIGGFNKADETFNHNFFSRGRRSQTSVGTITLKATIQPL